MHILQQYKTLGKKLSKKFVCTKSLRSSTRCRHHYEFYMVTFCSQRQRQLKERRRNGQYIKTNTTYTLTFCHKDSLEARLEHAATNQQLPSCPW